MQSVASWILAIALVAASDLPSQAQTQGGTRGSGGFIGGFNMIAIPAVQQELQLDEKQKSRAKEVASRMSNRFNQDMGKLKGLKTDELAKRRVALAEPHYEEGMRELRSFLKPAQVERFDQILLQQRGPSAMLEPKIAPRLKITEDQAKQIAGLMADATNEQRAAVQSAGNDQRAAMMKVEEIAAQASQKAAALLSPDQQQIWDGLRGEHFRPDFGAGPAEQPASGKAQTR